jgi:uncharacterized protein
MTNPYQIHLEKAVSKRLETKSFLKSLKKRKPKDLDRVTHKFHDETFEEMDCLQCANCCKTTSPIFTNRDIERLAAVLKLSLQEFIDRYLHIDEDGHYVLNKAPCPFLLPDNYCAVYESRPKACSEYPHTQQRKFHRAFTETWHNSMICPAVAVIIERLKVFYR